jgi:hypothetical protein
VRQREKREEREREKREERNTERAAIQRVRV